MRRAERVARARRLGTGALAAGVAIVLSAPVLWFGLRIRSKSPPSPAPPATQDAGDPSSAVVDGWGGRLLWSALDGSLRVSSRTTTHRVASELAFQGAVLSPPGTPPRIYTFDVGSEKPVIWSAEGSRVRPDLPAYDVHMGGVRWSPDGDSVAAETCFEGTCAVQLITASTGAVRTIAESNGQGISWSSDGNQLAFIDAERALTILDLSSGTTKVVLARGGLQDLLSPVWSPDADVLAAVVKDADGFRPVLLSGDGTIRATGRALSSPPEILWEPGADRIIYVGPDPDRRFVRLPTQSGVGVWRLGIDGHDEQLAALQGEMDPFITIDTTMRAALLVTTRVAWLAENPASRDIFAWRVMSVDTGAIEDSWMPTAEQAWDWN